MKVVAEPSIRCLILPCAGAGPGSYLSLVASLPADWEADGYCSPGRETRFAEPFAETLKQQAREVCSFLTIAEPAAPVTILIGHSLGGLLAIETASHCDVDAIVLCGTIGPKALAVIQSDEDGFVAGEIGQSQQYLDSLLADRGVDESAVRAELATIYARILEADLGLIGACKFPSIQMRCKIASLYGTVDGISSADHWGGYTDGEVSFANVKGGHFFPWENPQETVNAMIATMESR